MVSEAFSILVEPTSGLFDNLDHDENSINTFETLRHSPEMCTGFHHTALFPTIPGSDNDILLCAMREQGYNSRKHHEGVFS